MHEVVNQLKLDVQSITDRIGRLEQQEQGVKESDFRSLVLSIDTVRSKIDEIRTSLLGDLTGKIGIVGALSSLTSRVAILEDNQKAVVNELSKLSITKWKFTGAISAAALVSPAVWELLKTLVFKK